jgi:hypothetical protein
MLRPHHREDAQFDEVRLAAQSVEDLVVFLGESPWAATTSGVMVEAFWVMRAPLDGLDREG